MMILTILAGLLLLAFVTVLVFFLQERQSVQGLEEQLDQLSTSTTTFSLPSTSTLPVNTSNDDALYLPPNWRPFGPNISQFGIGSINAIAADPDFTTMYIGSSNGGVWKTPIPASTHRVADDNTTVPVNLAMWTPLTDQNECLSVSSISVSPNDGQFIVYACGKVSSYLFYSGPLAGLFFSYDGGRSWTIAGGLGYGYDMSRVAILSGSSTTGKVVAAAKTKRIPQPDSGFVWVFDHSVGGIFVSEDGAKTFQPSTDPLVYNLPIFDLATDPFSPDTIYASRYDGAVLLSNDAGHTWQHISRGIDYSLIGPAVNSRVALFSQGGSTTVIYTVVCDNVSQGILAWSSDGGQHWDQTMIPDDVAQYGGIFFLDLSSDPQYSNLAYLVGAVSSAYVADTTLPKDDLFRSLTNTSQPHADFRYILFDANTHDVLYLGCDGGIYSLEDPSASESNEQSWQAHNGNLAITEFDSIAYDPKSDSIASGAQDNGVWISNPKKISEGYSWDNYYYFDVGDGETVAFNTEPEPSVLYGAGQNLGGFFSYQVGDRPERINMIEVPQDILNDSPFYTDIEINAAKQSLILSCSATRAICWSFDFGSNPLNTRPSITKVVDLDMNAPFTNYFYGGKKEGQSFDNVIFAIAGNNFIYTSHPTEGTSLTQVNSVWYLAKDSMQLRNPKYRVAVNPTDYYEIVTVIMSSRIWRTTNFGKSWQDITGNLLLVSGAVDDPLAWGVAIVPLRDPVTQNEFTATIVGTARGIYVAFSHQITVWYSLSFDGDLPHVLISDVLYDHHDNVLILATMGRGWWKLENADQTLIAIYHTKL